MALKHWLMGLFAASGFLVAQRASAQEAQFATQGTFSVAAERVTGFTWTKIKTKYNEPAGGGTFRTIELDDSYTHFNFLAVGDVSDPYSAPRIGFDYFIIDGLSLGGSLAYATRNEDLDTTTTNPNGVLTVQRDSYSGHAFLFAPRVGYCYMFSDIVGIWPRGGFSYWNVNRVEEHPGPGGTIDRTEVTGNGFDFDAEAMLAIVPVPHTLIIVGPTLDFPITGNGSLRPPRNNPQIDFDSLKVTNIGIQAGLGVWF